MIRLVCGLALFLASIVASGFISPLAGQWHWVPAILFGIPAGMGLLIAARAYVTWGES